MEHSKIITVVCKNYFQTTQQTNFTTNKELQSKGPSLCWIYSVDNNVYVCVTAIPVISHSLVVMENLVSSVMNERSKSKSIMHKSLDGLLDSTISLFTIYLDKLGGSLYIRAYISLHQFSVYV